jgi:hypothetical protein
VWKGDCFVWERRVRFWWEKMWGKRIEDAHALSAWLLIARGSQIQWKMPAVKDVVATS